LERAKTLLPSAYLSVRELREAAAAFEPETRAEVERALAEVLRVRREKARAEAKR
jgi:hypothetical protein